MNAAWLTIKTAQTLTRISESDTRAGLVEAGRPRKEGTRGSVDKSHLRYEFGVRVELLQKRMQVL